MSEPETSAGFILESVYSVDELDRILADCSCTVHSEHPAVSDAQATERIWLHEGSRAVVHYLDDPTPGLAYLLLRGPEKAIGEIAFDLGFQLVAMRGADTVAALAAEAEADDQRASFAWQLAVVHWDFHAPSWALMNSWYREGHETVRHAVVNAAGYRGWTAVRPFLERVAVEDPCEALRANAAAIVSARWGESSS